MRILVLLAFIAICAVSAEAQYRPLPSAPAYPPASRLTPIVENAVPAYPPAPRIDDALPLAAQPNIDDALSLAAQPKVKDSILPSSQPRIEYDGNSRMPIRIDPTLAQADPRQAIGMLYLALVEIGNQQEQLDKHLEKTESALKQEEEKSRRLDSQVLILKWTSIGLGIFVLLIVTVLLLRRQG